MSIDVVAFISKQFSTRISVPIFVECWDSLLWYMCSLMVPINSKWLLCKSDSYGSECSRRKWFSFDESERVSRGNRKSRWKWNYGHDAKETVNDKSKLLLNLSTPCHDQMLHAARAQIDRFIKANEVVTTHYSYALSLTLFILILVPCCSFAFCAHKNKGLNAVHTVCVCVCLRALSFRTEHYAIRQLRVNMQWQRHSIVAARAETEIIACQW